MAFDGITIAALAQELNDTLAGGRIAKIAQPENDELLLTIKTPGGQKKLCISASASLPLIYLTDDNKPSPMTAPGFCMLLRKHIGNGRILSVRQPSLERVLFFDIEHLDEMGDLCKKILIAEIMGKHSNIIFCDDKSRIIDSIKHVSAQMSSVREVLPGREYFIPETTKKGGSPPCRSGTFHTDPFFLFLSFIQGPLHRIYRNQPCGRGRDLLSVRSGVPNDCQGYDRGNVSSSI